MISLDLRTVFIVQPAVSLTIGVIMLLYWQRSRTVPGLGLWGIGALCLGTGTASLYTRGVTPDWFAIVLAALALLLAPMLIWNGIRRFNGRRALWAGPLAAITAVMLVIIYYTYIRNVFAARVITLTLLMALGYLACAAELVVGTTVRLRPMAYLAALAFFGVFVNATARGIFLLLLGSPRLGLFEPTPHETAHIMVAIVTTVLGSFSLLAMANQRLQQRLEERAVELEALVEERDRARDRAEQESRAKSEFLAKMSHELRTPLNGILGFSELGRSLPDATPLSDELRQYFSYIHESGTHLLRLINDILDLSKVAAGKLEIAPTEVDCPALVENAVRLVSELARSRGQELAIEVEEPAPPLFADERAAKQMLYNLLANAIRFTPDGGRIAVSARRASSGFTTLAVSDTGIGIPSDQIDRVIRPFEQVDNSYARERGGTGLGLPLVHGLISLHGGRLAIESEFGRGTTVTLWFPPPREAAELRLSVPASTGGA